MSLIPIRDQALKTHVDIELDMIEENEGETPKNKDKL